LTTLNEQMIAYIGEEKMKVSCLITPEVKVLLQELFDQMSELLNTSMVLSDPDGTPVLKYAHFTELCKMHIRECAEGAERCMREAKQRGRQAEETLQSQVYKCHAGIFDYITPIILYGQRIGNIGGGQSFSKPPDAEMREHFSRYFDEIGVKNKEKAMRSIENHQVNSPERLELMAANHFTIGKLLSNFFKFEVEHNYWEESMTRLNAELEQRVKRRTMQLEEKVTELKRTQMQMIQQEKLAGIGQLAAGVAHEVNNPLGFIISNLKTLDKYVIKFTEALTAFQEFKDAAMACNCQDMLPHAEVIEKILVQKKLEMIKEDAAELLKETQGGLMRIAEIVQSLKIFTRVDATRQQEEYDLNSGIATTLLMVQSEYRDHVRIEQQLTDIPRIQANGSEMNQMLLSVIINAVQTVKERYQTPGQGVITITTRANGHNVICEIADNGGGIPEEVVKRIFEPFFTTKQPGKGTGLGLSVAHDAVAKLGGEIRVESTVGVGTKIIVVLPSGV
jgi:signal transduction histidine kinase